MGVLGGLAIAHPIYNYRFNKMKKFTTTTNALAAGGAILIVQSTPLGSSPDGDTDAFLGHLGALESNYCGQVMRVIFGPSTHANNVGAVESKFVDTGTTNSNLVQLESGVKYDYSAGDPLTFLTYGVPDGWRSGEPNIEDRTMLYGRLVDDIPADMKVDPFSMSFLNVSTGALRATAISIGNLLPKTWYTLTLEYMISGIVALVDNDTRFSVFAGGAEISGSNFTLGNVNTAWKTTSVIFRTLESGSDAWLRFRFATTANVGKVAFKTVSLHHSNLFTEEAAQTPFREGLETFIGSGLNDFTGSKFWVAALPLEKSRTFYLEIVSSGAPDQYRWRVDDEAWSANLNVTSGGGLSLLEPGKTVFSGLTAQWASTTGHTVGDKWEIKVDARSYSSSSNALVFTTAPDLGSIQITRRHGSRRLRRTASGSRTFQAIDPAWGEFPMTRYSVSYNFSSMPEAEVDQIRQLLEWQNRGNLLVHFPGIVGIPSVLIGKLRANFNVDVQITNFSLYRAALTFEEVNL